jgi:Ca2+-binding RTX toxin-like protein
MRRSVKRGSLWLAVVPVAGLALVLPSTAYADVDPGDPTANYVSVEADGTLSIGGSGLDNRITISPTSNGRVKIVDETASIHEWAPDCMKWTDHEYDCGLSGPITGLYVNGGGGHDVIVNLYPFGNVNRAKIYGGFGNDTIYAGPGSQQVFGGLEPNDLRLNRGVDETGKDQLFGGCSGTCADGNDVVRGGPGNDSLDGGPGNDTLQGGPGVDTFVGGSGGRDAVSYSDHGAPVKASLNGIADDGPSGEVENVPNDVEDLDGGHGADILIGNDGGNVLDGQGGHDQMYGMWGNDYLHGSSGNDRIFGGCADSCLLDGDDRMYGGTGDDDLLGGGGYNYAVEYLNEGNDVCQATVVEGCERIVK